MGARVVVLLCLLGGVASATPTVLRMATLVPDGTAWSREFNAFARDVETSTNGEVKVKWYLGGLAGDEMQVLDRIRRGQLDGEAGMPFCNEVAPSLKVMRIIGLFQSHGEAQYVLRQMRATLDEELQRSGFITLGWMEGGTDVVLSREPLGTVAGLRKARLWVLDTDEVLKQLLPAMGMHPTPLATQDAARAFDEGKLDGFLVLPSVAVAFQWQARAKYVSELRVGGITGCTVLSLRAFERLTIPQQQAVRAAAAKYERRIGLVALEQDEKLLPVLIRQGIQRVAISDETRRQLLGIARVARDQLGEQLVPKATLQRVMALLADYRAEHPQ
jgi:TRAP-type C4-dicarboxylate transport system substrate-binding protein